MCKIHICSLFLNVYFRCIYGSLFYMLVLYWVAFFLLRNMFRTIFKRRPDYRYTNKYLYFGLNVNDWVDCSVENITTLPRNRLRDVHYGRLCRYLLQYDNGMGRLLLIFIIYNWRSAVERIRQWVELGRWSKEAAKVFSKLIVFIIDFRM